MPVAPSELFRAVGLRLDGPARWGTTVRATRPGVFAVEWPQALDRAPIDISAVGTWIARVPTLTLDGARPTGKALASRLAAFWLPGETIVFVGMAPRSMNVRLGELFSTPLGDPGPYADARWLRALIGYDRCRVWWAETDAPEEYEDGLLEAFGAGVPPAVSAALVDASHVLPFANTVHAPEGWRLGIADDLAEAPAAAPGASSAAPAGRGSGRRTASALTDADLDRLNNALQRLACGEPSMQITPSQANAETSIRLLLREDPSRPPAALGQLLRAGRIEGAQRDLDGRWAIRCARRG